MDWYVYQRGSSPIRKVSRKGRRSRLKRNLLIVLVICAAAGLLWCAVALGRISSGETANPMQEADAGIILGMSMWGEEPSPGLKERLDYGLGLYREGKFTRFIVSGGLDQADYKYTEAEGMKNYLVGQGVPETSILIEDKSTSTYENLLFSQKIMQSEGLTTAVIITHTFHGQRSLEIARELDYTRPQLGLTDSQVMSMFKYKSREILAYTKWKVQQLFL
ncbi:YdcF family protein [Paenibacillus sp. S150]|uniref:YdcF family protein n=1 Tax=Paenibacillus sp. S150 TaxID=2749826 RepID=UPI001C57C7A6|nr:YdcF family protein [Paenibacillus sp. S150]MBW4080406.1 YdcF family protein [Paenibacillus sp. S150]